MSRFIPTPFDWTTHPKCVALRESDPANPDRWSHLINRAHHENRSGSLLLSDDTAIGAAELAHDHDRNVDGWSAFLSFSVEIGLLKRSKSGVFSVSDWKYWHRSASEMPENDKYRKQAERADSRLEKALEQVAELSRQLKITNEKLRSKKPLNEDQLKLKVSAEERTDRIPAAEGDTDSHQATRDSEGRTDRSSSQLSGTVRNCPESSGHRSTTRSKSTCRSTTKQEDAISRSDHPPPEHGHGKSVGDVVSFGDNVVFLNSDSGLENFWKWAETLFRKTSTKSWSSGKDKLMRKLDAPWTTEYPDPGVWFYALSHAVQESKMQLAEGKHIKCVWSYSLSFVHKYAAHACDFAHRKKTGQTARFRRLHDLEVAI